MDLDSEWLAGQLGEEDLDALFGANPAVALLGLAKSRAPVEIAIDAAGAGTLDPAIEAELARAVAAAKKLQSSPHAPLLPEEVQALHAFVHLVTRPSLPVRAGRVPGEIHGWPEIAGSAPVIERRLPGVGRLDTAKRAGQGTGWVVAKGVVITNNHVLAGLCGIDVHKDKQWRSKLDAAWPIHHALWQEDEASRPVWDPAEAPSAASTPARVTGVRAVHPKVDLALLEVDGLAEQEERILRIAKKAPKVPGARTYSIGYPAISTWGLSVPVAELLFGATSGMTKRLAPGLVRSSGPLEASHDATTLGGSSGSAIVSFALPHEVVALHFSGQYGTANYAVPLWELADDPILAGVLGG